MGSCEHAVHNLFSHFKGRDLGRLLFSGGNVCIACVPCPTRRALHAEDSSRVSLRGNVSSNGHHVHNWSYTRSFPRFVPVSVALGAESTALSYI